MLKGVEVAQWPSLPPAALVSLLQWEIQAVGHLGQGDASHYYPMEQWILESINAPRR